MARANTCPSKVWLSCLTHGLHKYIYLIVFKYWKKRQELLTKTTKVDKNNKIWQKQQNLTKATKVGKRSITREQPWPTIGIVKPLKGFPQQGIACPPSPHMPTKHLTRTHRKVWLIVILGPNQATLPSQPDSIPDTTWHPDSDTRAIKVLEMPS